MHRRWQNSNFRCVGLRQCRSGYLFSSSNEQERSRKDPGKRRNFDNPLALVLAPQSGDSPVDKEISRLQQQIRNGRNVELWLEQLGWAFVAKARESFDPGLYKLAEQCARSIEKRNPQSQEAMLLRVTCCKTCIVLKNPKRWRGVWSSSGDSVSITVFWAMP